MKDEAAHEPTCKGKSVRRRPWKAAAPGLQRPAGSTLAGNDASANRWLGSDVGRAQGHGPAGRLESEQNGPRAGPFHKRLSCKLAYHQARGKSQFGQDSAQQGQALVRTHANQGLPSS